MKRLYLMRHGHAPTAAEAGVASDARRPLSERGLEDARRMAAEILRRGGRPALILHSPLLRAAQTARAAADALGAGVAVEAFKALDNTLPPDAAFAALSGRGADGEDVLAVGHQPQLGEIAALLTGAPFEIRPAGVVAIELAAAPRAAWSLNVGELLD
ncbi:MAG: hypothetical protein HKL90_16670 [Elusimicrobia bacterium]|nr:hypothetical protein [Elusimicrobiota bacterium]